jgi:hypothetical protein
LRLAPFCRKCELGGAGRHQGSNYEVMGLNKVDGADRRDDKDKNCRFPNSLPLQSVPVAVEASDGNDARERGELQLAVTAVLQSTSDSILDLGVFELTHIQPSGRLGILELRGGRAGFQRRMTRLPVT